MAGGAQPGGLVYSKTKPLAGAHLKNG